MRINLCALFGLLLGGAAHAQGLPRENPVPGGIALLPLAPDSEPVPVVHFDGHRVMVARHNGRWEAVIGLPLTLTPGPQTVAVNTGRGANRDYSITVQAKEYAAQHITLKNKRMVEPNAEDLARITREQEIIRRAFATWTDEPLSSLSFRMPARGRISSVFGLRRFFNNEPRQPHSGIDIAAPLGAPIVAPFAGTVIEIGEYFFNGKTIFIDHGQGLISMFNHLSRILVTRGMHVKPGQKIGEVGKTGRVTGPHLHWTVSLNDSRVDPMLFLPGKKPRNE
ncbi:MAG: peptidoglycan DD-metalloendopeptidase family protein [Sulfuricaulis sp.]